MAQIGVDTRLAAQYLSEGGLVAIPTETVYGLGACAYNEEAILSVFDVKNRPKFDPLIVHIGKKQDLKELVLTVPEKANKLLDKFWPGPLTILLEKNPSKISDLITAGSDLVALRQPSHPVAQELLKILDFPLVAPSANPFGYVSPTTVDHVEQQLGSKIDYILDGGPCEVGLESTIVGVIKNKVFIFRHGAVTQEELEKVIGEEIFTKDEMEHSQTPGMLKNHYSPNKKLLLGDPEVLRQQFPTQKVGAIFFRDAPGIIKFENKLILSKSGSLKEAAKNLFAHLRTMDSLDLDILISEMVPNEGIGIAINDRLKKASYKSNQATNNS